MRKRETIAWLSLAVLLLVGAATVTRNSDTIQAIQSGVWSVVTGTASLPIPVTAHIANALSAGATPLAVTAHVQIVNHVSSTTHVGISSYGSDAAVSATLSSLNAAQGFSNFTDAGYSAAYVSLASIGVLGVAFEATDQGVTTYTARAAYDVNGVPVMIATANGTYIVPISAAGNFRVRVVDFVSGSVVVRMKAIRGALAAVVEHQGASGRTGYRCHSQANFVTSAPETLIAHTGNYQRLFICSVTLFPTQDEEIVLVEGTTAGCKTGTAGVWPGASAPHLAGAWHISTSQRIGQTATTSWLSTQTAGNPLCVHKLNATSRVSGQVIYGAFPEPKVLSPN